jgi:hypothetical protein
MLSTFTRGKKLFTFSIGTTLLEFGISIAVEMESG